jgi:hypothetical protein
MARTIVTTLVAFRASMSPTLRGPILKIETPLGSRAA